MNDKTLDLQEIQIAIDTLDRASKKTWLAFVGTIVATIYRSRYATQAQQITLFLSGIDHCSPTDWRLIQTALESLYITHGQIRMEDLAAQCGLSLRQLERYFKQWVGLTPKTLARIIRIETIRNRLLTEPSLHLTNMAYEFGYTDQSHFIHDFKAIVGFAPQTFITMARQRSMTNFYNVSHQRPPIIALLLTSERQQANGASNDNQSNFI